MPQSRKVFNFDHLLPARHVKVLRSAIEGQCGHQGGVVMLWRIFMLFMLSCMLGLIFQFRLGAIPLVVVLTTIVAFIKLIRRPSFN
jgi:hypothetical protein